MIDTRATTKSIFSSDADRQGNVARGLAWALPLGVCGFCVPYAVLAVVLILRVTLSDMTPFERASEWSRLPADGMVAALVCSFVFASAALASFSPRRGVGFVRSLLVMGCLAIVALFLMGMATLIFDLGPTKTSDPYGWLRVAIFMVLFLGGAVSFTFWQTHTR